MFMVKGPFLIPTTQKLPLKQERWGSKIGPHLKGSFSLTTSTKTAVIFGTVDISSSDLHWGLPKINLYQNLTLGCKHCKCSARWRRASELHAEKQKYFLLLIGISIWVCQISWKEAAKCRILIELVLRQPAFKIWSRYLVNPTRYSMLKPKIIVIFQHAACLRVSCLHLICDVDNQVTDSDRDWSWAALSEDLMEICQLGQNESSFCAGSQGK